MSDKYKSIDVADIPEGNYQGYYWLSDAQKPELHENESIDPLLFEQGKVPFVVEGNFYCKDKMISLQVKNRDGNCHIAQIDVSDMDEIKRYDCSHLKEKIGYTQYKMIEHWEAVAGGSYLADMETLEPTWSAFVGFE